MAHPGAAEGVAGDLEATSVPDPVPRRHRTVWTGGLLVLAAHAGDLARCRDCYPVDSGFAPGLFMLPGWGSGRSVTSIL